MKPSTNKEECTIDLSADVIPFSCIVDGNEAVDSWQITIYDITTNEPVLTSSRITLEPPFYPVDEKNRNVVFTVNLKDHIGSNNTDLKNREEPYYWTITLWDSSNHSTTSYPEVFYANKTPNVSISYKYLTGNGYITLNDKKEDNVLTSRACVFKAETDFNNSDEEYKSQLKRYGWKITDTDSGQAFIDTITNNQIYGSADNIICKYDGFLNGGNYSVELFIETQNNTKITHKRFFSVSYESTFLSSDFKVETLNNEPAIMLDWNKSVVISGDLIDDTNKIVKIKDINFETDYPVEKQSSIKIPDKFKVVYGYDSNSKFNINEDSYIAFSTQLLTKAETTLFFAEGFNDKGHEVKRKLSYSNEYFIYEVTGENGVFKSATHKVTNMPSEYVWYNIFMSPLIEIGDDEYDVELKIFEGRVVGCIYPSENLYPEEGFYPLRGNWNNLKEA